MLQESCSLDLSMPIPASSLLGSTKKGWLEAYNSSRMRAICEDRPNLHPRRSPLASQLVECDEPSSPRCIHDWGCHDAKDKMAWSWSEDPLLLFRPRDSGFSLAYRTSDLGDPELLNSDRHGTKPYTPMVRSPKTLFRPTTPEPWPSQA